MTHNINLSFKGAAEGIANLYVGLCTDDQSIRQAALIPATYNVGVYAFNIGTTIAVTAIATVFFAKLAFVLALGALGLGLRFAGERIMNSGLSMKTMNFFNKLNSPNMLAVENTVLLKRPLPLFV